MWRGVAQAGSELPPGGCGVEGLLRRSPLHVLASNQDDFGPSLALFPFGHH